MKTAWVVEADAVAAALLAFVLERGSFSARVIGDGGEAKARLQTEAPPAVVVLEISLPRADGFELIETLRALPAWQQVPVMVVSARGDEMDIARAVRAGADAYFVKPFDPDALMNRIATVTQ
ncbi:response regulator [uncultured Propionivibrio sp.]|uniref:response regulator transcription factor n=1 Tax=uncultured Propionivibrio sp. TaxID=426737 RepID=UPI0029C0D840|nr:response regulator [uncultured Propionivibrio sp.]